MIALIFPGQGAQKVGMLSTFTSAFPKSKQIVERIEDATCTKISEIIEHRSLEELTKTNNAQLAIFTTSMVCLDILKDNFEIYKHCKYMAGHSLGELSALCASEVFSLEDAAKIVKVRGDAMANACPDIDNYAMVALLGINADTVNNDINNSISNTNSIVNNTEVCAIANDNTSTQVVISGHKNAVDNALRRLQYSKAIRLNTSGPFHTSLMAPAAKILDEHLQNVKYNKCIVPVISNVSVTPIEDVRNELVTQITSPVQWRKTIDMLVHDPDITEIVELAPGKVLSSMLKREYPDFNSFNFDSVDNIQLFKY